MARILVIDDDGQVRGAIRRILERAGHSVLDVADGEAGIRLYRERHEAQQAVPDRGVRYHALFSTSSFRYARPGANSTTGWISVCQYTAPVKLSSHTVQGRFCGTIGRLCDMGAPQLREGARASRRDFSSRLRAPWRTAPAGLARRVPCAAPRRWRSLRGTRPACFNRLA